jgi:hypothetical protein
MRRRRRESAPKRAPCDPYCIRLIITEHIERLCDEGYLAEIEPDREYGYTSRVVFGVPISEIAALRDESAGGRELLWFHLKDGRMTCGSPDALGCGGPPRNATLQ